MSNADQECPAERLSKVIEVAAADEARALSELGRLRAEYPRDARLPFLQGSILASQQQYGQAHAALSEAVQIAPGYEIARFQLGLLEFTSGEPAKAEATWSPLETGRSQPLRLFVSGLRHLARDNFTEALRDLEAGIAINTEHPPLNHDMRLVIDGLRAQSPDAEPVSSAHLLLQEYTARGTKH